MTNLNQVSESYDHEQAVCDGLKDQIQETKAQINAYGEFIAHVDFRGPFIVVYISMPQGDVVKKRTFGVSSGSFTRALNLLKEHTKLSPVSPSSEQGSSITEGVNDSE